MVSLYELSTHVTQGDRLAWVSEHSLGDVERVHPHTVTDVLEGDEAIQVTAEGVRGDIYKYEVTANGDSRAFFVDPDEDRAVPKGTVAFAALTDDDMVEVRRGYFDLRDE